MVGWPLGSALAGAKPEWIMAGIGAGLIAVSIPITRKYNKQAKSAVDEYNGGLETSSIFNKTEVKMALTGNGIGLALRF